MKRNTLSEDGIRAGLGVLREVLAEPARETSLASEHFGSSHRNLTIGTVSAVEDFLNQATVPYQAIIATHRCKLQEV